VKLVVSDQKRRPGRRAEAFVPEGAAHQRCRVHFARNLLAHVSKTHADMAAAVFRTVFAQPDAATVAATWDEVRDQLATRFPKIGPLMDAAKADVLAFSAFPGRTGQRCGRPIRSNA
jgi:transposase-like protein